MKNRNRLNRKILNDATQFNSNKKSRQVNDDAKLNSATIHNDDMIRTEQLNERLNDGIVIDDVSQSSSRKMKNQGTLKQQKPISKTSNFIDNSDFNLSFNKNRLEQNVPNSDANKIKTKIRQPLDKNANTNKRDSKENISIISI